jgi:hypothetical protein
MSSQLESPPTQYIYATRVPGIPVLSMQYIHQLISDIMMYAGPYDKSFLLAHELIDEIRTYDNPNPTIYPPLNKILETGTIDSILDALKDMCKWRDFGMTEEDLSQEYKYDDVVKMSVDKWCEEAEFLIDELEMYQLETPSH